MKKYQLILTGRHPKSHKLEYQLMCGGKIITSACSYPEGYQQAASLMKPGDTLQEIQGNYISREQTYSEVLQGHTILNWDTLPHVNRKQSL